MNVSKEKWVLIFLFALATSFIVLFIVPNYKKAGVASKEASELKLRIAQLERRQVEVNNLRAELEALRLYVDSTCKEVPKVPGMSRIVQELSLDIDGKEVADQSFTSGAIQSQKLGQAFQMQPLAISMKANFDSIYSIIKKVEYMNQFVQIGSLQITRSEGDVNLEAPFLHAAIGLRALYDSKEMHP